MAIPEKNFLAGVIEGFYGPPWSQAERFELFDWMASWGLNTYFYSPKDDLKHRAIWREIYTAREAEVLTEICHACAKRNIRLIYGLGPGLDIRYHDASEVACLKARFEQMMAMGCRNFALLFDDIPDRMSPEDSQRWGSFASAQCHIANTVFRWARELCPDARFLFCPTPYCGRMRERAFGGSDYLPTLGRELLPEIDVFWTGPEIISREITVPHIRELQEVLHRKPLIWDNLHANDYDGRRFYCGPYSGRPPELLHEVRGLLVNPNNEFPLNFVPFRTLAAFVHGEGPWDTREAYLSAMEDWLPHFATVGQPVALQDLILFGDCFYLPYELGPEAQALYQSARDLVAAGPDDRSEQAAAFRGQATRLQTFCVRMTELRQRPLFNALSRRVWDLREELDLLGRYADFISRKTQPEAAFRSDFHLPGTYRGGMVAQLQRLLEQQPDGTFTPAVKG
jgi:protein O-GlcNAcase / histone acetyltransferase